MLRAPPQCTTRTSCRRSSRPCRVGRPQRPRLRRDRPSRSVSFRRATRRCGRDLGAGYFDAGDLDADSLMPRWAPSTASKSPSTSARSPPSTSARPSPSSTSARSATSTRSTFLGAIDGDDEVPLTLYFCCGRTGGGSLEGHWWHSLQCRRRVVLSFLRACRAESLRVSWCPPVSDLLPMIASDGRSAAVFLRVC